MCGRYFIAEEDESEEIRRLVELANRRALEKDGGVKTGEVFPSDMAAVVLAEGARPLKWGLPSPVGKGLLINARSETAADKPFFRGLLRAHRCLIPAGGYYEWEKKDGAKIKYAVHTPGRPFYMAGLYRPGEGFVILTRPCAAGIAFLHERMPVILPREALRPWLNGAEAEPIFQASVEDVAFRPA